MHSCVANLHSCNGVYPPKIANYLYAGMYLGGKTDQKSVWIKTLIALIISSFDA